MRPIFLGTLFLLLLKAAGAEDAKPVAVVETSFGTIEIELDRAKAPKTVANFLGYVDDKFYDDTVFHRVINNFMIQGGCFTPELKHKKDKAAIVNEAGNGLHNTRGTVAMARLPDPNTATSDFYINVKDNTFLDKEEDPHKAGYCVFGKVIKGMDVVDKIKSVDTGIKEAEIDGEKADLEDVPVEAVLIKSVRLKGKDAK
jgi:peptidyl-prolyl cis-trans isomerase A (cyclophilin A)